MARRGRQMATRQVLLTSAVVVVTGEHCNPPPPWYSDSRPDAGPDGGVTAKDRPRNPASTQVPLLRSPFDGEAIIMFKLRSVVALVAVTMGGTTVADIINVGPGDSIQAAIDAAVDGDEIIVAPGTYFETINFLGKAVTVRSSDGPGVTVIDAQGSGSVVTCGSGEGPDTVLDGFTITGGNGTGIGGGGMFDSGSSPTVTNCSFSGNSGGGNSLLYCPPPRPPCPTDSNDDGFTNVLDLVDLLLAFGTSCP